MAIKHVDIIVVGAGLIGSAMALLLSIRAKQAGKSLTIGLVERAQALDSSVAAQANQRVVALGHVAHSVLDEVGVFDQLGSEFSNPYERMFVWDENSDGELEFNALQQGLTRLGHMVDSQKCTQLLQKKLTRTSGVTTYYQAQPQNIKRLPKDAHCQSGIQLCFCHDGIDEVLQAPLIVAADGAQSWVRQKAKIFANHHSYQQHGIVAKVEVEHPHQNTAWQRFLSSGPLALLPIENNQCSIVWSVSDSQVDGLMALEKNEFEQRLTSALGGKLGNVLLKTTPQAFALVSQRAQQYFTRNIVLVGDAAHSIHPLAGQGANLGFKDIDVLVDILCAEHAKPLSEIGLLRTYQRKRKPDNQQTDLMMSALHHAYRPQIPFWLALRGLGMNVVDRSGIIKSWLVKQAIGL